MQRCEGCLKGFLKSWSNISSYSIVYGFKIRCISNGFNGSEDNVQWKVIANFINALRNDGTVGKDATDNSQ